MVQLAQSQVVNVAVHANELGITPERLVEELLSRDNQPPGKPEQQLQRIERFERSRDAIALELARSLAQDNITVEEFSRDVLA